MPFIQLQFRRDTPANWTSNAPVLASGEIGIEIGTELFKIGDGTTTWPLLPYGGLRGPTGPAGGGGGGPGIPVGGNAGAILTMASGVDYDTLWSPPIKSTIGTINMIYTTPPTPPVNPSDPTTIQNCPIASVTYSLPSNFSAYVSGTSVYLSNTLITALNANSSNYLLIPTAAFVTYASYNSATATIGDWSANKSWTSSPVVGNKFSVSGSTMSYNGIFGTSGILGPGGSVVNGDGTDYTLAILTLSFNSALC